MYESGQSDLYDGNTDAHMATVSPVGGFRYPDNQEHVYIVAAIGSHRYAPVATHSRTADSKAIRPSCPRQSPSPSLRILT